MLTRDLFAGANVLFLVTFASNFMEEWGGGYCRQRADERLGDSSPPCILETLMVRDRMEDPTRTLRRFTVSVFVAVAHTLMVNIFGASK